MNVNIRLLALGSFLLAAVVGACGGKPSATDESVTDASDVDRFWAAYDALQTESDSAAQIRLLDSLFVRPGTPGLEAMMERRGLTAESYRQAVARYPRFWSSVRDNTLRAGDYSARIESAIDALEEVYPRLSPARLYFTVGALMTPGMTLDDVVFIGSEVAMTDSSVVTDELPDGLRQNLRAYFDSSPIDDLAFLNLHEYVHTQQGRFGSELLSIALQEGVAEFVATLASGEVSPTPAVAFGASNERAVRERFATEMFSPNTNDWLYNNFDNQFGVRDLGYYVGYAIAEKYYEKADDKIEAVAELIELDYRSEDAVAAIVDSSGYFDRPVRELRAEYEASKPEVVMLAPFDNGSEGVAPGLATLSVTFSQTMSPRFRGFDFGPGGEDEVLRVQQFIGWSDDARTMSFEVSLEPGRRHQLMLTSQFRTAGGAALEPYLIEFEVADEGAG